MALFLFMGNWFEKFRNGFTQGWKSSYDTNPADLVIPFNHNMLQTVSGDAAIELLDNHNLYHQYLHKCSPLAAILYKRAEAFASGNVEVLARSTGNSVRGINKEWQKLIDKPNWMQTKTEFLQQLHLYKDLYGWVYVMPMYPAGYADRPYELWILPPECMTIEAQYRKAFYKFAEGEKMRRLWFTCNGETVELDESKLILFKDSKTPIDCETWLPESRITSLRYPISKLISAEEAGITLIQRKGAIGILSNDLGKSEYAIPLQPGEKEQLQQNLAQYGLTRGQWQIIVSNANLKWQPMAFNVAELQLAETYAQAVKDLCDGYGYPFPLSAHSDQSTYNNVGTADRLLYQNSIIPEAKVVFEQFDYGVNAVENNIEIWCDYSKVPALQATAKEQAEALMAQNNGYKTLYDNDMLTPNQWLEKIGENKVADPDFDLYKSQRASTIAENERANKIPQGQ